MRLRRGELEDALDHIEAIHVQVMRSELFRGYRPAPMAATAVLALVAAALQWTPALAFTRADTHAFAVWWLGIAAIAGAVCLFDAWRAVVLHHGSLRASIVPRTLPVILQFVPALAAGAAVTYFWLDTEQAAFLPALWSLLFGLGVMSSRPFLPRAVGLVGAFYLTAACIVLAVDARAGVVPSPWSMGLPFGVGQAALAAVLYCGIPRGGRALPEPPSHPAHDVAGDAGAEPAATGYLRPSHAERPFTDPRYPDPGYGAADGTPA